MVLNLASAWPRGLNLHNFVKRLPRDWGVVQLAGGITPGIFDQLWDQWKAQGKTDLSLLRMMEYSYGTGAMVRRPTEILNYTDLLTFDHFL